MFVVDASVVVVGHHRVHHPVSLTHVLVLLSLLAVGGGKSLTARLAGQRAGAVAAPPPTLALAQQQQQAQQQPGAPPSNQNIVAGYNVEALVDAALGKAPMPTAPTFLDTYGQPLTQIVPILPVPAAAAPALTNQGLLATLQQVNSQPPLPPPPVATAAATQKTRVLVLLNMVTEEDLATAEDHQALVEEVRDECSKFGRLAERGHSAGGQQWRGSDGRPQGLSRVRESGGRRPGRRGADGTAVWSPRGGNAVLFRARLCGRAVALMHS